MNEEWRPIEGYEGIYEISNFGRVKSLERVVFHRTRGTMKVKERILKPGKKNNNGYKKFIVILYKDKGVKKTHIVSVLVARAFIPNNDPNKKFVLHGRNGSLDNKVSNLYWGTQSENMFDKQRDGTDHNRNKTHCPYGAILSGYNLINPNSNKDKPGRSCLACKRVRAWLRNHDGDYQTIHDLCFENNCSAALLVKLGLLF